MRPGRAVAASGLRELALTGTPGTGKSCASLVLGKEFEVGEVAEWAIQARAGRRIRGGVQVDLKKLQRRWRPPPAGARPRVVVGHLAHLLPIREVVVLRCHPVELARRLSRARRGSAKDRRANVEAEALDVVLVEALGLGRRVHEIDTTCLSPDAVARRVRRVLAGRSPPSFGRIDWLADGAVTDYLLHRRP